LGAFGCGFRDIWDGREEQGQKDKGKYMKKYESKYKINIGEKMSNLGYDDPSLLPGGKWHVHDGNRPKPRVVTPASELGAPPSDAIILFDGTDLSGWQ